jgi:hypothetical protein
MWNMTIQGKPRIHEKAEAVCIYVPYILEEKPPPNKRRSRFEARGSPASQDNKCQVSNRGWVPSRGCGTNGTRQISGGVVLACERTIDSASEWGCSAAATVSFVSQVIPLFDTSYKLKAIKLAETR